MNYRRFSIAILSLTVILLGSATASGGSLRRVEARVSTGVTHGIAFAALEPIGEAEGWGRAIVRDDELPNGLHRTVQIWLFGMRSRTLYRIDINDLTIGYILTRSSGSGVLKLQNIGRGHDPVPEDLPPASDLESIAVFGPSDDAVLQGSFTNLAFSGGMTTYEEEIALEDVGGTGAAGMAKVEMKEDGHQEFKSHATGLVPGSTYSVVVDSLTIGSLTADGQGQAGVHLEDPDDDNPLPPQLLPVSDIVKVEWLDSSGEPVLFGQFSGVGVCEHLVGTISMINPTGFTLEIEDRSVSVVTTVETVWNDFDGNLPAVGDKVKIEGCWADDEFVAEVVELKSRNDAGMCTVYVGAITSVSGENFLLDTDAEIIAVMTTDTTEWKDFDGSPPAVGDEVKVEGCWSGDLFVAEEVELKGRGREETCLNSIGIVTAGTLEEFTLETNKETITVITTDDTELKNFRDHELGVGDKVKVKGCWDGDSLVAEEVQLIRSAKVLRVT